MSPMFLALLVSSGLALGSAVAPVKTVDLLVNFFNILYSDQGLDFHYDFGNRLPILQGDTMVSVWGPMELRQRSYVAKADNDTKLVAIELQNKQQILINANTYDDLELHHCQIHLLFAVENLAGTTIRPISAQVDNCDKVSYTDGTAVQEEEDLLQEVSKALLSKSKDYLQFYYSGMPRLGSFRKDSQQELFAALLYFT